MNKQSEEYKSDYRGYKQAIFKEFDCRKCENVNSVAVYGKKSFTINDILDDEDERFIFECRNCGLIDPHQAIKN